MSESKLSESNLKKYTCCFFGHRRIETNKELENAIYNNAEKFITNENVYVFLFGSRSQFNDLCYDVVTKLKEKYSHIQRIYVRAEYPYINDDYKSYLLESYEDTYFPEKSVNAGRASYVERNQEIINKSSFCIVYYDESYLPPRRKNSKRDLLDYQPKSGTKIAYDYALKKGSEITNLAVLK